ncbi:hypothetical protein FACS189430_04780 [Bacteroidia bacterium]|nr:hypothetical protein FACS189430_04780 [Bacteroidia bacterium]
MKTILSTVIQFVVCFALNAQNLTYIDMAQAKFENKNAEEIFKDFEIVPLETHKNGLLIPRASYYLTDKYIIGMNFLRNAYLFDRKTGAFIREISSYGRGPDEYEGLLYNQYGFDEENNILFAGVGNDKTWKCINIETNKVESIVHKPLPEKNNNENFSAYAPRLLKDSIYISFCNNTTGKNKTKLIVYGKNGTLIKKYPNHLEYNPGNSRDRPFYYGIFYSYNGLTYFKEMNYNDTVFSVNEKAMSPHIVFKLGNKQPSYYHQRNEAYNKGKYFINFVYESKSFILFNFSYSAETMEVLGSTVLKRGFTHTAYYDKKRKQVFISSTPDLKESGGYNISGIPVRFYPMVINKNKEMLAKIDPAELIEYKDKIEAKYKDIFKNVQEDDNPVVIIAKLKE